MGPNKWKSILLTLAMGGLLLAMLLLPLHAGARGAHAAARVLFVKPHGPGTACAQAHPCDLQTAIAQAADGDTIYLAQGTYTGSGSAVLTLSKSITLYGGWDGAATGPIARDPEAHPSVLDGESQRRVVYIEGNITPTLDGLVIARGNATHAPDFPGCGGGVCSFRATPTIAHCTITGNVASMGMSLSGSGGGIHIRAPNGTVVITASRIISNAASLYYHGTGGGLTLLSAPEARVIHNVIMSNTAVLSATRGYGGGVAVSGESDHARLQGNVVQYNVAIGQGDGSRNTQAYGGGIYAGSDAVIIRDNEVLSNTAIITGGSGSGGGIAVMGSDDVTITDNQVAYNVAQQDAIRIPSNHGGGIYCFSGDNIFIQGNIIQHNTASIPYTGGGGGVYLSSCHQTTLADNLVRGNLASHAGNGYGGGFHAYASRGLRLDANRFLSNTASLAPWGRGGGLYFSRKTVFTMTNNIVAANYAIREGGGVAFETSATQPVTGTLVHNTFAANDRGEGNGRIAIHLNDPYVTLVLTNTLIYSHTYGLYATSGSTATLYHTLFYANSSGDTGGPGTITNMNPITGQDPLLAMNFHLLEGSPAIDAGVPVPWLLTDIDGEPRPLGAGYDIGADEAEFQDIYFPLVTMHTP